MAGAWGPYRSHGTGIGMTNERRKDCEPLPNLMRWTLFRNGFEFVRFTDEQQKLDRCVWLVL
jgi:hypothetical protein